jgi:hypothetical protein
MNISIFPITSETKSIAVEAPFYFCHNFIDNRIKEIEVGITIKKKEVYPRAGLYPRFSRRRAQEYKLNKVKVLPPWPSLMGYPAYFWFVVYS